MKVVVTGGSGFLGARVVRQLLGTDGPDGLDRLTILDVVPPDPTLLSDPRVTATVGDLAQLSTAGSPAAATLAEADVVVHLAGAVSAACEADFDLGLRSNLDAGRALLEACRRGGRCPIVVFASSLAVYGSPDGVFGDRVVDENTVPAPQTSYGAQKVVLEYLLADYSRKGYLRGRSLRLMTVTVRPGRPNAAASGFLSGIIREPLAGLAARCPVPAGTAVAVASPQRAVEGLLAVMSVPDARWNSRLALNLPALTVTVDQMCAALERVAGRSATALIEWRPDPAVADLVTGWPARFDNAAARALGLWPDPDFDSIIRAYLSRAD